MVLGERVNVRRAQSPKTWQLAFAPFFRVRTNGVASEKKEEKLTEPRVLSTTFSL